MSLYATRGEIVAEVKKRGYDHVDASRVELFVDEAASELQLLELWDFRRQVVAGAAPLAIDDEAIVKHVRETSSGRRLWPMTESEKLNDQDQGAGSPVSYYLIEGGDTVRTVPESTTALTVVLHSVRPWTTGGLAAADDNDVPLCPQGFRDVIVKLAEVRCALDDGRTDHAAGLRAGELTTRLEQMREALLRQGDEPRYIKPESIW